MHNMGISNGPPLLEVELPLTLLESPSVSTFMPEEEASMCPLLSTTSSTPLAFSHPLSPSADLDSNNCEDTKAEISSSSGSSSGIAIDVTDASATGIFNCNIYHHLGKNDPEMHQTPNGLGINGHLVMKSSTDAPSFVAWNWPLIRRFTFFVFISIMLALSAVVVAMIITLPTTCNPKTTWFRGSVFYEIFPASYQDTNNDGIGDLKGITSRLDYLSSLGISVVRLNSIFPTDRYPEDYYNTVSLLDIAPALGTPTDLSHLARSLHKRNMFLILDLPMYPAVRDLQYPAEIRALARTNGTDFSSFGTENLVSIAMQKWIKLGVDGFYVKGLETFSTSKNILYNLAEWKYILGPDRPLIIHNIFLHSIERKMVEPVLEYIDLVDIHLDIRNGTQPLKDVIRSAVNGPVAPRDDGTWIHWSIGGVSRRRLTQLMNSNATLAATIMQLMLPGSPNIFYGDEIALEHIDQPNEHKDVQHLHHLPTMNWGNGRSFTSRNTLPWIPQSSSFNEYNLAQVSNMISLREQSPSIYKNSICKPTQSLPNTQIRDNAEDVLIIERVYPRRNSFVSISNFSKNNLTLDLTKMYYSGHVMIGDKRYKKIYFSEFKIGALETIVIKLDK